MIILGVPTYDSRMHNQLAMALLNELYQPDVPQFSVITNHSSLLARGFNELYCHALNRRPEVTHFLMIHADVIPEPGFVGALYREMERTGADVLSAVLPLKDNRGLTSTGLDDPTVEMEPRRISMVEVQQLPETFDSRDVAKLFNDAPNRSILLVNSGLMLVDIRKPWVENCWFAINDQMLRNGSSKFEPVTESEDWFFSRRAQELGARVMVTRTVKARHAGEVKFPNWGAWGSHQQDDADQSTLKKRAEAAHV